VLKSVKLASELEAHFRLFHELIENQCCEKLSINDYFATVGLSRFVPTLAMRGFFVMEDLECDDEQAFTEDIFEVLESAVNESKRQWEEDKGVKPALAKKITKPEKKRLAKICYKKSDVWQKAQAVKTRTTKKELCALAPSMVTFFKRLDSSLTKALELLEFGSELNTVQKRVVMKMKQVNAPKSGVLIEDVSSPNGSGSGNKVMKAIAAPEAKPEPEPEPETNSNSNSNSNNDSSGPIVEQPADEDDDDVKQTMDDDNVSPEIADDTDINSDAQKQISELVSRKSKLPLN
jgi:hypothetical protein